MPLGRRWLQLWLVPELGLLDLPKDQGDVYSAAVRGLGAKYVAVVMSLMVVAQVSDRLVIRRLNMGLFLGSVAFGILIFGLTVFGVWLFRRAIRLRVRRALNERGIHVCLGCAYLLRGLTVPRCPECGRAFDPAELAESTDANVT